MDWHLDCSKLTVSFTCLLWLLFIIVVPGSEAQYSDERCKCICPPGNQTARAVFITHVSPDQCNCYNVVLPKLSFEVGREFCARCQCKHESRNSSTIKIVVIGFIVITGLLLVYMVYLLIEARFFKGNKALAEETNVAYEQHLDEEEYHESAAETQPNRRKSFGSRFHDQMTRWKKAVMQQRGNVYVRRTVLNN